MSVSRQPDADRASRLAACSGPGGRSFAASVLASSLMLLASLTAAAEQCGPVPLPGAAGPYDYVDSKFEWNLNDINLNHWVPAQRELRPE